MITDEDVTVQTFDEQLDRAAGPGASAVDIAELPNRDALERHLATLDRPVSLLVLDVDHFTTLNAALGARAGDTLLAQLAARLLDVVPAGTFVARTGGNSFSVVADGHRAGRQGAVGLAADLLAAVRSPFALPGRTVRVSACVGVALPLDEGPESVLLVDALHRRADLALAEAKSGARGRLAVWEPHLSLRSTQRLEAQQDLRAALADVDGVAVHYQPIVDVRTRELTAVESLVRLRTQEPELGATGVVSAAEDTGLMATLDRRVVDLAQRDLPGIGERVGTAGLRVHVNVSAEGLADPAWLDAVETAADDGHPRLCIEVTEQALVATGSAGARHLEELRDRGHLVALDDFGAGYTSLATLASIPADLLKLDRSLMFDVVGDPRRRAVLAGAVTLARDLGLTVVAEGVETEDQHHVLIDLECDEAQGWLHGRPAPLGASSR